MIARLPRDARRAPRRGHGRGRRGAGADRRRSSERLGEQLRKAVGGKVAIDIRVDPSLLGGLVVKLGSRMVDASLKSKLQRLELAMKGVR